jgi:hypothetical protein
MTDAAGFWVIAPLVDETWDVISVASLAIADLAGGPADFGLIARRLLADVARFGKSLSILEAALETSDQNWSSAARVSPCRDCRRAAHPTRQDPSWLSRGPGVEVGQC